MKTRTRTLFASILLTGAVAMTGCGSGEAGNAPAAPPAAQVTTAVVATRELNDWADFTGRLEAVENVAVRPRVGGYVESVQFAEGARVAQGDLLVPDRSAAVQGRGRAAVGRARSRRCRARRSRAPMRDRAERLLAQNATSREEYEQLAANASVAQAQARGGQRAALEAAQLNLSFTRVTSPIAGRVSRAVVTAGNLVDGSTLLTTVVSDSPVYAYFDVDEQTYLDHVQRRRARATSCTSG